MVLVRNLCVPVVPVHLDLCTDRQYVMYVVYYVMYLNMMHVHPRYWYIGTPASFCCAAVYHTCVHIFIYLCTSTVLPVVWLLAKGGGNCTIHCH
jgi:hypothetical protein